MSNTIDNRTVQMDFENKRFESGVQDSLKSIDALKKGLSFEGATKGLENIDASTRKLNFGPISDGVNALANRFSLMGIVGIAAIQNITNRLIGMAEQIAKTFVIDPIKTGLEEYETKLNAVQTILANTQKEGTDLKIVTDALNQLNEYSDKTIYNFQQMTRNVGTFTAAGVSLKTSVSAIKGIANLAAVSGAGSEQASSAMYQLSQALATGTLKLMDWNSVVNAGMGGQIFQDALKETARVHGVAVDQIVKDEGSFRDSLQKGWVTSEILTETLAKFTGDLTESQLRTIGYNEDQIAGILKMGKTANDAATKVKTLTQLNQTLKEAAQSGWAQTWELIAGDFEEAKAFFTELSDTFGGILGANADARNALVRTWKDLGGRTALLDVVRNSIQGILSVVKPFTDALKDIFPPITGEQLANFTKGLATFTEKFKIGADTADKLKRVFKGFFAILDIGKMLIEAVVKSVFGLSSNLKPIGSFLESNLLTFADYIVGLRDMIKNTNFFSNVINRVKEALTPVITKLKEWFEIAKGVQLDTSGLPGFFKSLADKIKPLSGLFEIIGKAFGILGLAIKKFAPIFSRLGSIIGEGLNGLLDKITDGLNHFDPSKVLEVINAGLLGALLVAIRKFVTQGGGVFEGVSDLLDGVRGSLEAWQQSLKAKTLLQIGIAIGILAASLFIISTIDSKKLIGALGAITALFVELFAAMNAFGNNSLGVKSLATVTAGLIGISTSLLILSGAVAILGGLDSNALVRAMVAIGVLIGMMQGLVKSLSGNKGGMIQTAIGISIFAVALNVMALAVRQLGNMDTGVLTQGLIGIGILMGEIAGFLKLAGGSKGMLLAAVSIGVLSVALLALSGVIFVIGSMPLNKVMQGLLGIALSLGIVTAAMQMMPPDMILTSAGLLVVAGALVVLSLALKNMGGMSWDEIGKGLVTLAGSLTILTVAMSAMTGLITGSAALLVAAVAIAILAVSLKALGSMSLEEIGLSLLAIAGVLTVLGVAAGVLTPLIPSLLGLAVALALIGVAALATGIGVLALSIGLTALAIAGAAGAAALVVLITSVISLLPMIAKQLGLALISLITTIANGGPVLLEAIVKLLLLIIDGLIQIIPKVVDAVLLLVTTLLQKLAEKLPDIVQAGYDILLALLRGIADNAADVIKAGTDVIIALLGAWSEQFPRLVDAGYDAIVSFIDGLADAAEKNIPRVMAAMSRLGVAIVKGVLQGLVDGRSELLQGIADMAQATLEEFSKVLGIHSPADAFIEQAGFITQGLVVGFKQFGKNVYSSVDDLANETVSRFGSVISKLSSVINSEADLDPTIRPVMDLTDVINGSKQLKEIVSNTTLNLSPTVNSTKGINVGTASDSQQSNVGTPTKNEGIQFIQNNYSPKELSRIEIYRQTKNQLLQTKGLVGG